MRQKDAAIPSGTGGEGAGEMAGVVFRRVLWCVVVGGWPAVAALRMGLDPGWGTWLTLAGAPAEAVCALLLRAGLSAARGRRSRARETERRLAELEQRMGGLGDTLAAAFRYSGMPRTGEPRRLRAVRSGDRR